MINKFKAEEIGIGFNFDIELEKDQKIYCFIGENGIGKTQLLENMAKSLIYTHSIFKKNNLNYSDTFTNKETHDSLKNIELKLPSDIDVNNIKIKNKNNNSDKWGYTTFEKIAHHNTNGFTCDKPIVFIGAQNRGYTKNICISE